MRRSRRLRLQRPLAGLWKANATRLVSAGPSSLRYRVVAWPTGKTVRTAARQLSATIGYDSGVYVLVRCDAGMTDREVIRATLSLELEVLYIGLSETKWYVRTGLLGRGLSGGALTHDAARQLADAQPRIDASEIRMVLVAFSPAFSLESFLLREHMRATGRYPQFNRGRGTRSSARVRKRGVKVGWRMLLAHRRDRPSGEPNE